MQVLVQRTNRIGIVVVLARIRHTAAPQNVVDQKHSTRSKKRQHVLVVHQVVLLVGINEGKVITAFFTVFT